MRQIRPSRWPRSVRPTWCRSLCSTIGTRSGYSRRRWARPQIATRPCSRRLTGIRRWPCSLVHRITAPLMIAPPSSARPLISATCSCGSAITSRGRRQHLTCWTADGLTSGICSSTAPTRYRAALHRPGQRTARGRDQPGHRLGYHVVCPGGAGQRHHLLLHRHRRQRCRRERAVIPGLRHTRRTHRRARRTRRLSPPHRAMPRSPCPGPRFPAPPATTSTGPPPPASPPPRHPDHRSHQPLRRTTALAIGTTYYYIVTAVNAAGESEPSPEVSAAPAAPAAARRARRPVTATPGDAQIVLSWAPVPGATSYNIYWVSDHRSLTTDHRNPDHRGHQPLHSASADLHVTYYYIATAVNAVGESAPSSVLSARTRSCPPHHPPRPSGVSATPGDAQITISWDPAPGIDLLPHHPHQR